jgi:hypothetical protein
MARRRRRRRNPVNKTDWMPILIGATGGGLAMYLYLKNMAATAPATQTVSVTTPTLPTLTTTPAATG